MLVTDHYGRTVDTDHMGPRGGAYLVLPGCPLPPGDLLRSIMDRHVAGIGPGWRDRSPVVQSVEVGAIRVWLATHPDPRSGARLTVAMSEAELRERLE